MRCVWQLVQCENGERNERREEEEEDEDERNLS